MQKNGQKIEKVEKSNDHLWNTPAYKMTISCTWLTQFVVIRLAVSLMICIILPNQYEDKQTSFGGFEAVEIFTKESSWLLAPKARLPFT